MSKIETAQYLSRRETEPQREQMQRISEAQKLAALISEIKAAGTDAHRQTNMLITKLQIAQETARKTLNREEKINKMITTIRNQAARQNQNKIWLATSISSLAGGLIGGLVMVFLH